MNAPSIDRYPMPLMGYWRMVIGHERPVWSAELYEIFGVTPSHGPPRYEELADYFEEPNDFTELRRRIRGGENPGPIDLWIKPLSGGRRLLRISTGAERDGEGIVSATFGLVVDITDLNRAAQEATAKEQLLATFIDHAPAALAMFDMDMRYLRVSPRWLSDYGLEGHNLIGCSHYEVFPEIGQPWKDIHQRCLAGAIERCERDPFDRADGRRQWLSWEVRPWRGPTGEIGGILMLTRDVTELVTSIEALENTERRLHLALEASGMLVWQRDRRTGDITVSGAQTQLLGRTPRERLSWDELIGLTHADDREAMLAAFAEAVATKRTFRQEHRLCPANRDPTWVLSVIEPTFDADGVHTGAIGLLKDIAEQRAQMDALKRAQQAAETSSAARSRFVSNMSHEIRTPLNGVFGAAQALARTNLDPRQRELIDLMMSAGTALRSLVDDALDLGRIDSGDLALQSEAFSLGPLVRDAANLFQPAATDKKISFRTDLSRLDGHTVVGDPLRVRQIVSNIVGNAVKFTQSGGVAIVADAQCESDAVRVLIMVSDTGPGITPGDEERVFERFEQSATTMRHALGGSGLGLSIARSLARAMDGDVTLHRTNQRGAQFLFEVEFPLARDTAQHSRLMATPSLPHSGAPALQLLVAEDNPFNQQIVSILLEPFNVDITFASDGSEAHSLLYGGGFGLVLMDMQMPRMTGLEAIRAIRAREASRGDARIPIICLTAETSPENIRDARAAGADAHVTKPIQVEDLLDAIDEVLRVQEAAATQPLHTPIAAPR